MKRIVVILLAAAFGLCTAAFPAHAHHSHPIFYDQCKTVTVEGRVERVEWKDPHIQIYLTLDDGTTYRVEWTSLRELTNNGIAGPAQEVLRSGARVVAMGNPPRDGAYVRSKFPELKDYTPDPKSIDLLLIRRADDTWSWKAHDPAECARQ
ncbi:MAG TPA: DUF6152 family protein [Vicinamibacterales bacterium]|jgi:hypothetical protein